MTTYDEYHLLFNAWKKHIFMRPIDGFNTQRLDAWLQWKPEITEIVALGFEARIANKLIKYAGTLTLIGAKATQSARFNKRTLPAAGKPSEFGHSATKHGRFRQAMIKVEFIWPIDNSVYYEYGIVHQFLEWCPFGTGKAPTLLAQVSWFSDLHRSTKYGLTIVEKLRLRVGDQFVELKELENVALALQPLRTCDQPTQYPAYVVLDFTSTYRDETY